MQTASAAGSEDPLDTLQPPELAACARLLASSLAHHRAKFGVVPIARADEQGDALNAASAKTLDEALAIVKDKQARSAQMQRTQMGAEQRHHPRVSVNTPVRLAADNGEVHAGQLANISWGGAAVRCQRAQFDLNAQLTLIVPSGGGDHFSVQSTVLRESSVADEFEYGLRFESLDPEDEEKLEEVLRVLLCSAEHDDRRSEVRLVQRLEIEYGDAGEFQATLEDISASGLMLTVPDPLEIDQSLLIALSSSDTPFALNLRARVVHQQLVDDVGFDMYRVGLKFEHPTPKVKERVSALINELAVLGSRKNDESTPRAELNLAAPADI
ncbi:MAG: PilZ domain-containing protein [Pseudomonadota bacterium]